MGPDGFVSSQSAIANFEVFRSYFSAKPSPARLERFGGRKDGAYLVPLDLRGVVACFSAGADNRKKFEDDLLRKHKMRSHIADYSSDLERFRTPFIPGNQTFTKKWIDVEDRPDSIRLGEWVDKHEPTGSGDLLLQMDIEGAEYRVIGGSPSELLARFRVIVIELHDIHKSLSPIEENSEMANLISRLSPTFAVVHCRANNCAEVKELEGTGILVPDVMEFTLIRRDRLQEGNGGIQIAPRVPHPREISANCRSMRPLHLSPLWTEGSRGCSSKLKIVMDWASFLLLLPLVWLKRLKLGKIFR